ncbi:WD40 repeat domain-containing serine/threonine protein kinase [Kamptonema formosum]|uniref:WD40 repeat domain-containing serine/threonine protein kinase n=1 Tax=Kamptonema formosum TaxID=331992 RepID=UPI00034C322A|nr:serine/threonine-protein kinase [Oscillatoria sp. PCC 10802]
MRCLKCHLDGIPLNAEICPNCQVHLPSLLRDVLPPSTRLDSGAYEIDYALGRGGFGMTYRARHTRLQNVVAIKEYYPFAWAVRNHNTWELNVPRADEDAYQRGKERFLREGQILARLNHPNVVSVRDLFEERNTAYLVMELISGSTLRQELDAQPANKLPARRIAEIMGQLVPALEAVHKAGLCHLDIKPQNIMLTPEGRVVLVDFGAAKQISSPSRKSSTTRIFTEEYAAPEIRLRKPVGPESDIFELGMTLHEMLVGELPDPGVSRMFLEDTWTPAGFEEPWRSLLSAALRVKKEERPTSVREWWESAIPPQPPVKKGGLSVAPLPKGGLAEDLRGYFTLPQLPQQGMVRRLGRGEINNVIPLNQELVLVCAGGGAALFNMSSGKALWEIDCPASCGTLSPDGTLLALGGERDIYLWDLRSGQFLRQLSGHGNSVCSVAFSPDGKILASGISDKTVRLWDVATGSQLRQLSGHGNSVNSVAFSPDGKILASVSGDNTVRLWDVATGRELRLLSGHGNSVYSVAFSPDGTILASGNSDETVRLWDVATGSELRQLSGHKSLVWSVAFSPNGKILASGSDDNTVRLWDVATGSELRQLSGHGNPVNSVAFSPDGKILASGSFDNTVRLWNVATGSELRQLSGHGNPVNSVAFSPDGKILASGSGSILYTDNTVRLWDVATGSELRQLSGHESWESSVAFSPDGKILASGSYDKTVRLWDVATGSEVRQLSGHGYSVCSVAFSPDGKILASGSDDKTVRLWDVATGSELRQLSGRGNQVKSVAFSPDGTILASGSKDETVRLWDVATGRELRLLSGHGIWVNSVAFSPDGKILASGSSDKTVRLWDVTTGSQLRQLSEHGNSVLSVAFSPDGKILASGSWNGVVRLWAVGGF